MIIDEKKLQRQQIGIDLWINNGCVGMLEWCR